MLTYKTNFSLEIMIKAIISEVWENEIINCLFTEGKTEPGVAEITSTFLSPVSRTIRPHIQPNRNLPES